jgi:hypothetical protein
MDDAALSIQFTTADLSVTYVVIEHNTGDQPLSLDGVPPSIRGLTCVHNTGTNDGMDSLHGLISTGRSVQLIDCVFLHNQFDAFVTSWEEGLTITLVGCVFTPGALVAEADSMRIETTNCTIQEDGEPMIGSGFCPTIIPRTTTPMAYFTPPLNYKYLPRFDVITFGLFLFTILGHCQYRAGRSRWLNASNIPSELFT